MIQSEQQKIIYKIQEKVENEQKLITREDCQHHGYDLNLFCESCEEPICNQCCIIGPHNNHLHRISQLNEAYEIRHAKLSDLINNELNEKKNELIDQIQKIEVKIEDVQQQKNKLTQVIQQEYQGIFDRLKQSQGEKVALLQNKINIIQKEINDINYLCNYYIDMKKKCEKQKNTRNPDEIVKKNRYFIDFLLKSAKMNEAIDLMVQKQFRLDADIDPDDLPHELTERRVKLKKIEGLKESIQFKDQVILDLIELKKKTEKQIKEKYQKLADTELEQWANLTQQYQNQLQSYQKLCFYCGVQLSPQSVNSTCVANSKQQDKNFKGYTIEIPDFSLEGNAFHFFGQQNPETCKNLEDQLQDQDFYEILLAKFRKIVTNVKDINQIFEKHDKKKDKTVNLIQFQFIMTEILKIDEEDTNTILKILDPKDTKQIKYEDFLKLLNDQNYLAEFLKNSKGEKKDEKKEEKK